MKSLKLNQLNKENLQKIKGGDTHFYVTGGGKCCGCACAYADKGGSSVVDNANANHSNNLNSPGLNCKEVLNALRE